MRADLQLETPASRRQLASRSLTLLSASSSWRVVSRHRAFEAVIRALQARCGVMSAAQQNN